MKKFIFAVATLSGTIIGVGLFSLPYIASQVGIMTIFGYFFFLGGLVIIINLLFGEVALHTPDFLRLPGYAKIYLGEWGKRIAVGSAIFGFWGALLAYLIVGGKFLTFLLQPTFGGDSLLYTMLYFSLGALFVFFGMKAIAKIELLALILFALILGVIVYQGFPSFQMENLFPEVSWNISLLFLPYGAILFSLWGASLIPEIEEFLGDKKTLLKKVIPVAILIPIVFYLVFTFFILGITGDKTSPEAIQGLTGFLGPQVIILAVLFGILTTFTSFITLGLTLKKVFWYDLKISKNVAWLITCFIPLFLFLWGVDDFIQVIGLVGGVLIAIDGILIILIYQACKKISGFSLLFLLTSLLIFVFLLGIVYEIYYFITL